jgi:hypothetical protein
MPFNDALPANSSMPPRIQGPRTNFQWMFGSRPAADL